MTRARFSEALPGVFFLDGADPEGLEAYLRGQGWLAEGERILELSSPGESNMNCVLRARTSARSLIVKQARPWVEKYPQFAAPRARARIEGEYFAFTAAHPRLAAMSPQLLGQDPRAALLLLEDLGETSDFRGLYADPGALSAAELSELLGYLSALHNLGRERAIPEAFENAEMRALNHAHIFDIPLDPKNGLDLEAITPGLTEPARALQADARLVARIHALGQSYLEGGPQLVHGDFYPASWLRSSSGLKVIDAEFCLRAQPEFDTSVLLAHLTFAGAETTQVFDDIREQAQDRALVEALAGAELIRRLIGFAQLPLSLDLEAKVALLTRARDWILPA